MGKGSEGPSRTNPVGAANTQTLANRPDINTPWATTSWSGGPESGGGKGGSGGGGKGGKGGSDRPTLSVDVNDTVSDTFGNLQQGMQAASQLDPTQARNQAIGSNLDWAFSRINPMLGQQNKMFNAQMANTGMIPGMEGFGAANRELGTRQTDLTLGGITNAINQGNQTQDVMMRQAMLPYQQYGSLIGSTLRQPQYGPAGDYQEADKMKYAQNLNQFNAEQGKKQSGMGSIGDIAGMAAPLLMMLSDERLKTNIVRHEREVYPGVPEASWEWRGIPGIRVHGVIAQDLEKVLPEYVHTDSESGLKMVDYSFIGKV